MNLNDSEALPIVTNADAQAALNAVAQVPEGQPLVRVVRAWKLLQVAGNLFEEGTITEAEYGKFHAFYFRCTAVAAGLPTAAPGSLAASASGGPPGWFRPAMQEALQPLKQAVESTTSYPRMPMHSHRPTTVTTSAKKSVQEKNASARDINSRAYQSHHCVIPIRCETTGEFCDIECRGHILEICADEAKRRHFLEFYGLPITDDTEEAQAERIKKFVGIPLR